MDKLNFTSDGKSSANNEGCYDHREDECLEQKFKVRLGHFATDVVDQAVNLAESKYPKSLWNIIKFVIIIQQNNELHISESK